MMKRASSMQYAMGSYAVFPQFGNKSLGRGSYTGNAPSQNFRDLGKLRGLKENIALPPAKLRSYLSVPMLASILFPSIHSTG